MQERYENNTDIVMSFQTLTKWHIYWTVSLLIIFRNSVYKLLESLHLLEIYTVACITCEANYHE